MRTLLKAIGWQLPVCTSKRRVSSEQDVGQKKRKLSAVNETTTNRGDQMSPKSSGTRLDSSHTRNVHPSDVARNTVDTSAGVCTLSPIEQIVPLRGDVASHLVQQSPRFAKMISKITKQIEKPPKSSTTTTSDSVPPKHSDKVINLITVFNESGPSQREKPKTEPENANIQPQISNTIAQQFSSCSEDALNNHSTNRASDTGDVVENSQKETTEVTDYPRKHTAQQGADEGVMEGIKRNVEEGEVLSSYDSDSSIADNDYYDHKLVGKVNRERSPSESSDSTSSESDSRVHRYRSSHQSSIKKECSHHCQYCLMRFDMLSTKLKHEVTVHGFERCRCNPCCSTFTEVRMDVHIRKSHKSQLHCFICHFQADTRWKIADHKESCH